jgi:DNA replication protein DnaC
MISELQNEIKSLCSQLSLKTIANYQECIQSDKSFEENLCGLLRFELLEKEQRGISRRTLRAGFPMIKLLDTFEHGLLPNLKKEQLDELTNCEYIKAKQNCVMIGNSGTGKTHVLIGLGIEAIKRKYSVRFFRVHELITLLKEAEAKNTLTALTKRINEADILLLDELGYIAMDKNSTNHLFSILASRYETKSTLITTNFEFSKWIDFLGDENLATALVDRLVHKTCILDMRGPSYRLTNSQTSKSQIKSKK